MSNHRNLNTPYNSEPSNFRSVFELLERNTELSFLSLRTRLTPGYWICLLIANLAAWGFEQYYAGAQFNTLYFRLTVCAIGIPLFLTPFPRQPILKKYQRLYFVCFMILMFPMLFSWNALANASFADSTRSLSGAWLTEYALATFIFLGLFSKPIYSLAVCFIALAFTASISYLVFGTFSTAVTGTILFMVATIITAYCFLLTTQQQLNFVLQHRLETAYSIGSRVAHELRTPLLSIKNFATNAKLTDDNHKGESTNGNSAGPSDLEYILKEVEFANRTIDILLISTTKAPFHFDVESTFQAKSVVESAIAGYPYGNQAERRSVKHNEIEDFEMAGPHELIVHALYNLIKNALLSASSYSNAKIEISHRVEGSKGIIEVTDNGPGIPFRLQHRVFEDFFTTRTTGDGTGLGLAFCKSLMSQLGGKITYKRDGELSVFRMSFPID